MLTSNKMLTVMTDNKHFLSVCIFPLYSNGISRLSFHGLCFISNMCEITLTDDSQIKTDSFINEFVICKQLIITWPPGNLQNNTLQKLLNSLCACLSYVQEEELSIHFAR